MSKNATVIPVRNKRHRLLANKRETASQKTKDTKCQETKGNRKREAVIPQYWTGEGNS